MPNQRRRLRLHQILIVFNFQSIQSISCFSNLVLADLVYLLSLCPYYNSGLKDNYLLDEEILQIIVNGDDEETKDIKVC